MNMIQFSAIYYYIPKAVHFTERKNVLCEAHLDMLRNKNMMQKYMSEESFCFVLMELGQAQLIKQDLCS